MDHPAAVVVADLTRPAGEWVPGSTPGARLYRGHPFQARASSIEVLRQVISEPRALVAVRFEDVEGVTWTYTFGAYRGPDGKWKGAGGAGGSGGDPNWPRPWVNYGGWGPPNFVCLGGRVSGPEIAKVRVKDARNAVLEDVPESGVSLILSNEPVQLPLVAELLDPTGDILKTQSLPWR